MDGDDYLKVGKVLGILAAVVTFLGAWGYCAATYGFLFGFGLGWLPAGILAVIVGFAVAFLWGLIAIAVGLLALYLIFAFQR